VKLLGTVQICPNDMFTHLHALRSNTSVHLIQAQVQVVQVGGDGRTADVTAGGGFTVVSVGFAASVTHTGMEFHWTMQLDPGQ
jgi:hypothetical protein